MKRQGRGLTIGLNVLHQHRIDKYLALQGENVMASDPLCLHT